jgi:hypothetical protein
LRFRQRLNLQPGRLLEFYPTRTFADLHHCRDGFIGVRNVIRVEFHLGF